MSANRDFDALLGDCLDSLIGATGIAEGLDGLEAKPTRRALGDLINQIWAIRERLHTADPAAKPTFLTLYESNRSACETLFDTLHRARDAESAGQTEVARHLYKELLESSKIDLFRTQAQAGLYRLLEQQGA